MIKRVMSLTLAVILLLGLCAMAPSAGAADSKLIALTFDDGPGPYTSRLLDGLAERGAKVTFFMVGSNVARYPETVQRVYREGHQIANHSYDHQELTGLSDSQILSQIDRTNDLLDKACGEGTEYLVRAPYGSTNSHVRSLLGVPLVYWSVDPQDWKYRNATTVKNHIVRYAEDGAIILLHDIHSTSVDAALDVIDILQGQGYEFVTVRELFRRRGVEMEDGVSHVRCKPTGVDLGPVQAPTITGKTVDGKLQITLSAQEGADIYYTTDGSDINREGKRYTGPFTVATPCTLRAVAAFNMNGSRSQEAKEVFTLPAAETPEIQIDDGRMTLTTGTTGASIYYTLDDTKATTESVKYEGPVDLTPGVVIRACAGGKELLTSDELRVTYSHLGNLFRDVFPGLWYYETIDRAADAGYMEGLGDNYFKPNDTVTRAQLVTLLYRYSGETVTQDHNAFTDVPEKAWYTEAVCWAAGAGIVEGYGDGTFQPDKFISRQEMCKVFATYLTYKGNILPEAGEDGHIYEDQKSISLWALPYVQAMTACGMFQGDDHNCFCPLDSSTRAQAATVLMRLQAVEEALPDVPPEPSPEDPDPAPETP